MYGVLGLECNLTSWRMLPAAPVGSSRAAGELGRRQPVMMRIDSQPRTVEVGARRIES